MSDKDLSKEAANEQLMPCPFCGERAYIVQHNYVTAGEAYGVRCFCGAQSDQFFETMGEAVDAWNTRVPVPREMTAREYETALDMMEDSVDGFEAKRLWNEAIRLGFIERAVAIVKKWAREHPEEANDD